MKTVTVKKNKLLKTLKENQKTHEADFEIAWEKFKERTIHNFQQRLIQAKDLKKGQHIDLYVNLDVPENHSEDYQRAIEMIDWEISDEVELTEHEFRQYVQDMWGWSGKFSADNQFYTGAVSPSAALLQANSEPDIADATAIRKSKQRTRKATKPKK